MIIYVDMDDTLCEYTDPIHRQHMMYQNAVPKRTNIQLINKLYDQGHHIAIWTSRGVVSGIDWKALTEHQLQKWDVKYHTVDCTKPCFDLFLDDKALNSLYHFDEEWINRILDLSK